ncbi:MAG: hypothetical protein HY574_09410 [candidate division NC10 bacterium]|nr:hypothetical protein [candidate division NC10 bacterium]
MILKHRLLGLALVGSLAVLAAPVVAGSGWLLLAPPELPGHGEGGTKFEVHAPPDRWTQVRAFDTAQECEDLKTKSHYEALRTVWIMYPSPPDPSGAPPRTLDEIIEEVLKKDRETIEKGLKEAERQEAMMTEEQKQKKGRAWQEWKEKIDKIVVARKPMERAVHEQYRHWTCVPADAVYGPGVKRKP